MWTRLWVIQFSLCSLFAVQILGQSDCWGTCPDVGAISTRSGGCLSSWQYIPKSGSPQTYYGCGAFDEDSGRFWCMTSGYDEAGNNTVINFTGSNYTNCMCSGWTRYFADGTSQLVLKPYFSEDENGTGTCPTNVLYESQLSQNKNWKYCTSTKLTSSSLSVMSDGCLSYWKEATEDGGIIDDYEGCQAYDKEAGQYWCLTNGYVPGLPSRLSQANATAQGGVQRNCLPGGWTYYGSNSTFTSPTSLFPSETGEVWCPSNVYQHGWISDEAENKVWKYCNRVSSNAEKEILTLKSTSCVSQANHTWQQSGCSDCIQAVAHIGSFVSAWTLDRKSFSDFKFTMDGGSTLGRFRVPLEIVCQTLNDSRTESTFWSSSNAAQFSLAANIGIPGASIPGVGGGNAHVGVGGSLFSTSSTMAARAWKKKHVYVCAFNSNYEKSTDLFTDGARKALNSLPSYLNDSSYPLFKNFFQSFGTHVVMEAFYGGEFRSEVFQENCSSGISANASIGANLEGAAKLLVDKASVSAEESFVKSNFKQTSKVYWFGGDPEYQCKPEDTDWGSYFTSVASISTLVDFKVVGVEQFLNDSAKIQSFSSAVTRYLQEMKAAASSTSGTDLSCKTTKSSLFVSMVIWPCIALSLLTRKL